MRSELATLDPDQDEREGKASMSGAERLLNCPGSFQLSRGLSTPEKPWTRDGNLGHAALANEAGEADLDGHEDVAWAAQRCQEISSQVAEELGFSEEAIALQDEARLWLHDDEGHPVASGRIDRAYIKGKTALIFDWKLGRKEVAPSPQNPQLIGYALLLQEEYGITEAFLKIVQPWRKGSEQPVAHLTAEGMAAWKNALLDAIEVSRRPDAPRHAGKWCDYCPARPLCPEAREVAGGALALLGDQMPAPLDLPARYDLLTPEQKLTAWDWVQHAKKTLKEFEGAVKAELEQTPDAIPGLFRKPDSASVTIESTPEAMAKLVEIGVSYADFAKCSKPSLNSLASVLTGGSPAARKLSKAAEEKKEELKAALAGYLKTAPRAGVVERIG